MKKLLSIVTLLLLTPVGPASYAAAADRAHSAVVDRSVTGAPQGFGATLNIDFCYSYLSGYGTWVTLDPYGYVWRPRHMGYRWRPYSEGHWVWTDYGWTWIDDTEWGWMPFHYGRWGWDDDFGWYWVPGTIWGPAWVVWRSSDMYMGWAPIPPGFEFRAGVDFAALSIRIPGNFWVFIGGSHLLDPDVHPYVVPYERNATIVNYTRVQNNVSFRGDAFINDGVSVDTVRRITHRDVPRYSVQESSQPGATRVVGNTLQIYRPSFTANRGARPATVLNSEEARRELAPAKVYEPRQQKPTRTAAASVQQRQAEERTLMRQTQSQEVKDIQRRQAEDARRAQSAAEKAKVQQDYRTKTSELAKQHQAETQQLSARQKEDTKQVQQARPVKQQAAPVKQQAAPKKK